MPLGAIIGRLFQPVSFFGFCREIPGASGNPTDPSRKYQWPIKVVLRSFASKRLTIGFRGQFGGTRGRLPPKDKDRRLPILVTERRPIHLIVSRKMTGDHVHACLCRFCHAWLQGPAGHLGNAATAIFELLPEPGRQLGELRWRQLRYHYRVVRLNHASRAAPRGKKQQPARHQRYRVNTHRLFHLILGKFPVFILAMNGFPASPGASQPGGGSLTPRTSRR
jgi:hypothetical protein